MIPCIDIFKISEYVMSELDNARNEINIIDKEMAERFVRRMKAAEIIAESK